MANMWMEADKYQIKGVPVSSRAVFKKSPHELDWSTVA